ncbi:MAG: flavodoxin family protein [Sedimentisphaerales bacterium]|nr:flavodoxin family protein [Sedimentisphaerales bacterium]
MNILAINGSGRRDGNTAILLNTALEELRAEGFKTEMVQLAGQAIRGCTACGWCREHSEEQRCVIDNDPVNECITKMIAADGILFGSPVYFADVTAETKALIDRAGYVCRGGGNLLKRKVGAAVIAVRRAGAVHAFDTINHFFLIGEMIVVGSNYWNLGMGGPLGEVKNDSEGLETMRTLGKNMAWLIKQLKR